MMKPKTILYTFVLLLLPLFLFSQKGLINEGSKIVVEDGFSIILDEDMEIYNEGNGAIYLDGELSIQSDITNNAPNGLFVNPDDLGEVFFIGSGNQYINGSEDVMFDNVTMDANGLYLNTNIVQYGDLFLSSGNIFLRDNIYTLGSESDLTGSFSTNNMFVVDVSGFGELRRQITHSGTFEFPVGTDDSGLEYTPFEMTVNNVSANSDAYVAARVNNEKYSYNPSTSEYLNRYWTLASSGINSIGFDATFYYLDTDVVGDENAVYGTVFIDNVRTKFDLVDAANNSFTIPGQSEFYVYTGADEGTGIEDLNEKAIRVYPNPSSGKIYISHNIDRVDQTLIELVDQQGTVVLNNVQKGMVTLNNEILQFDFSEVSAGMYFLRFTDKDKTTFKKLIIN